MSNPIIHAHNLSKHYQDGSLQVEVLKGVNLTVQQGERIAIVGASGSGKSTLLHCLGALELPSGGQVTIDGEDTQVLSEKERGTMRNQKLGFVYQFHHLLPEFTALENVAMPLIMRNEKRKEAYKKAESLLGQVGLSERLHHKPSELSGGERQRAAVARALVASPRCVLADEPTGNLDTKTADGVYDLILRLNQELKTSFVIVTHDMSLAKKMDRILSIVDGVIADVTTQQQAAG